MCRSSMRASSRSSASRRALFVSGSVTYILSLMGASIDAAGFPRYASREEESTRLVDGRPEAFHALAVDVEVADPEAGGAAHVDALAVRVHLELRVVDEPHRRGLELDLQVARIAPGDGGPGRRFDRGVQRGPGL